MTQEEMIKKTKLRRRETPEALEMAFTFDDGIVIEYNEKLLISGFYWNGPGQNNHFGAIYQPIFDECLEAETDLELVEVSTEFFKDDGHAIEWAISKA